MNTTFQKVIFLLVWLAHTSRLCFASYSPLILETRNYKLKTDSSIANYGPHGEDWESVGTNPTPFAWLGGYGVQTLETDTPLKLYLTRHRVYSATLNRFLSSDPMGLEGGLNLYAYGEGNPMAYIDPLGLCAEQSVWSAFWEGFGEGLKGGGSILANTFTFGYSDAWGWTDSTQYQGFEYDVSRFSANVARGALAGAGTAGLGNLAAAGNVAAQVGYGGIMAAGVFQGGAQIGYGIGNVIDGNYLAGAGQIAGGSLSAYGSYAGLNSMMKTVSSAAPAAASYGTATQSSSPVSQAAPAARYSADQSALIDLAWEAKKLNISPANAQTLLNWGNEYNLVPTLNHTIPPLHWNNTPHIRIGPVNHIKVIP